MKRQAGTLSTRAVERRNGLSTGTSQTGVSGGGAAARQVEMGML